MSNRTANLPFAPAACPVFYGWPILGFAALGLLMSVPAQTIGLSVFTEHLLSALDLTRSQLSFAYMFGTLGSACLLPWAGPYIDRVGCRTMAVVASICLAFTLFLLSQSDLLASEIARMFGLDRSQTAFTVIFILFMGLRFWGQGIMTLSSHNMVAKWFDRRRGLASGISGFCVAIGFSSAPLVMNLLIQHFGWRGTWLILAVLIGVFFSSFALLLYRDNPEHCGLHADGGTIEYRTDNDLPSPDTPPCLSRLEALQTLTFWTFSLSLALFSSYMTGLTFHIVSIFEASGMSGTQGISTFLPAALIAVTVHLTSGWLESRVPLDRFLIGMLTAIVLSCIGLTILGSAMSIVMLIIGNGIAGGVFGLLTAVTWARVFGRRHLGAISGLHMSIAVMASALGPVLFSQSFTRTGSYRAATWLYLASATALLLAALRCDSLVHRIKMPAADPIRTVATAPPGKDHKED